MAGEGKGVEWRVSELQGQPWPSKALLSLTRACLLPASALPLLQLQATGAHLSLSYSCASADVGGLYLEYFSHHFPQVFPQTCSPAGPVVCLLLQQLSVPTSLLWLPPAF